MCLSKKILYQYFAVYYPACDSFFCENISCHYIALKISIKNKLPLTLETRKVKKQTSCLSIFKVYVRFMKF